MSFNPHSDRDLAALRLACKQARQEMEFSQKNHVRFLKELAGKHGASSGAPDKRPLNLLEVAWTIYRQNLLPDRASALVVPRHESLRADAARFELALNAVLGADEIQCELETAVMEAMFSPLGIVKIALDVQEAVTLPDGSQIWTGPPRITAVTYDHWVQDTTAASPQRVSFCGDRYFLDRQQAMESGLYDPEVLAELPAAAETPFSQEATTAQLRREESRRQSWADDYRQRLPVWDIWLPDEGLLLTLAGNFDEHRPLRIVPWSGPRQGPYPRFSFGVLPGNSLPVPPVAMWIDMHDTVNILWNKLVRQAERQKINGAVEISDQVDGETLKAARDGDYLALNRLGAFQEIRSGGIDQLNLGFLNQALSLFKWQAGGLDLIGGLAPMSRTLGQDKLLSETAAQRLKVMQSRVRDWLRRVFRDMAEYLWHNPLLEIPVLQTIPGTNEQMSLVWNRAAAQGEFPDYLVDLNPYARQDRSPQERLAQLQQHWREDVLPALPYMQQAGIMPNFEAYFKLFQKYQDLPEAEDLLVYMQGQAEPRDRLPPPPPPQTRARQYVRVSVPSPTAQSPQMQEMPDDQSPS